MSASALGPRDSQAEARRSVGNYLSSVVASYALLVLAFGVSVYLTRTLGAEGFGRLTLAITVAQTASLFAAFWLHSGFLRHGAEALVVEGSLRRVFWARMFLIVPLAAAIVGGAFVFRTEIAGFHGVAELGFGTLALYFVVLLAGLTVQAVFHARGRAGVYTGLQAVERAVLLAAFLALHVYAAPSIDRVFLAYVVVGAGAAAMSCLLLDRGDLRPVGTSQIVVRRLVTFSWPLLIAMVTTYLTSSWLDLAVIRHLMGTEAVGQFALAYQLMGAVQQLPTVSFPVTVPLLVGAFVADETASIRLYLDRIVPHAVWAMALLLSFGIVAGPAAVLAVFGEAFAPAARALPVLLMAVGAYAIFIAYIPILNLRERSGAVLVATIAAGVVNLAGILLLVPLRGIGGAAWATTASQATAAVVVAVMVKRDYPLALGRVIVLLTAPVIMLMATLAEWSWPGMTLAGLAAAGTLVLTGCRQGLGSMGDRRLLARLDLPLIRRFLPAPAAGDGS